MNFVSAIFLIFIFLTLFFYYIIAFFCPAGRWARRFLLGSSLFFYSYHNFDHLILLIGIALLAYMFGRRVYAMRSDRESRGVYGLAVISTSILLLPLLYFKYADFIESEIFGFWNDGTHVGEGLLFAAGLPLGISFFTFQAISFVTDVHRKRVSPTRSFEEFLLYISFFPQLVAGPIVTAREFFPRLKGPLIPDSSLIKEALFFLGSGILKKAIFADRLAGIADPIFLSPDAFGWQSLAVGMFAYTLQIYLDFSAYSDLALGLGRLFGIRLPENFYFPYSAEGLKDFWRRWHITLSSWLRDHIYIPLGGNRMGAWRMFVALLITMTLGGIWHGAHWNFLIWGVSHGFLLIFERILTDKFKISFPGKKMFGKGLTFIIVSLLWIPFRTGSGGGIRAMMDYYRGMIYFNPGGVSDTDLRFVLFSLALVIIIPRYYNTLREGFQRMGPNGMGFAAGIFFFLSVAFSTGAEQFIYFVF